MKSVSQQAEENYRDSLKSGFPANYTIKPHHHHHLHQWERYLSFFSFFSLSPSPMSKHDTTREQWSAGAISEAKFSESAAVVLFHTLIPRRMCNYTAAGGRCGFSHKKEKRKKKSLMNESMRSCLRVGSIGVTVRKEKGKLWGAFSLMTGRNGDSLNLAAAYVLLWSGAEMTAKHNRTDLTIFGVSESILNSEIPMACMHLGINNAVLCISIRFTYFLPMEELN